MFRSDTPGFHSVNTVSYILILIPIPHSARMDFSIGTTDEH